MQFEFKKSVLNSVDNLSRLSRSLILAKQFLVDEIFHGQNDEVITFELELVRTEIEQLVARVKTLRNLKSEAQKN